MNMNIREVKNEFDRPNFIYQKTFEYDTWLNKYRLRIVKRMIDDPLEVDFIRVMKVPKFYWRKIEEFGIFYRMVKFIHEKIVTDSYVIYPTIFYIERRWGIIVNTKERIRDDKIGIIMS